MKKSLILVLMISVAFSFTWAVGSKEASKDSSVDQKSFPLEPIEMVSHAGVGGGTDIFMRTVSLPVSEVLGTELRVVTKTGGVGAVALQYVARRPRDGYTVFALLPGHLMTIARGNSPVGLDEIVPLVRCSVEWNVLLVKSNSSIKTIEGLIDEGRKRKIKFGGAHIGAIDHIAVFLFAKRAGLQEPLYVPFDGGAAAQAAVISGDVEVAVSNVSAAESAIQSGDIRPIVVLGNDRLDSIPTVPTTKDLGINATSAVFRGLGVMKGTPEDRIEILEKGFLEGMSKPAYISYLAGSGMTIESVAGREEWTKQIQQIYADSVEVLTDLGMIKK